jgi:hypothetical protein
MEYIYADSRNRDVSQYPSSNSYVLYLATPLQSVHTVKLLTAKVPNTVYNITNGSNVFTLNSVNYSIQPGFYSAYGLASAITSSSGSALSVKYLSDCGKFLFSAAAAFTLVVNTTELKTTLGLANTTTTAVLGYTNPVYVYDTIYSSLYIIVSDTVINLNKNNAIFLDIEEFRNGNITDARSLTTGRPIQTYNGSSIERVTGVIAMDVDSGMVKTFKAESDFAIRIQMKTPVQNLQRLTIRWVDKDRQLINFNGYDDNSFVLEING